MSIRHKVSSSFVRSMILVAVLSVSFTASDFGADEPSPDEVLATLTQGNVRYVTDQRTRPHQDASRRTEVTEGQHPIATVISCSDSRVPPEFLFDQGIGDLFIVRVAGNVSGVNETGSAEYGVEHLETPLLVVMGHTKCGAVTAVVTNAAVHGNIPQLLTPIQPAVKTARKSRPDMKGIDLVPEAIKANVFQSISDLFKRSEIIRTKARQGEVKVVGAVYDIQTGHVDWLGPHPEQATLWSSKSGPSRSLKGKH